MENTTTLTYNANGTVATSTDGLGRTVTFTYTYTGGKLSRIVATPPMPLGTVTANFDGIGRVTSITDGKGQVTSYTYDKMNRRTRVTHGGDTACGSPATCTNYTYDDNGNVLTVTDASGTTTHTYSKQNRQLTKMGPGGNVTYTYDGVGNLLTVADAGGTTTYAYDAANNLSDLYEPGQSGATPHTTFAYDANNRRRTTSYPNGVTLAQDYDGSGRLTRIRGTRGAAVITDFAYSYTKGSGDTALRQRATVNGTTVTDYTYDELNRLTGAVTAGGDNYQYRYDPAGNRTEATLNGTNVWTSPTYNAANQLTAVNGTTLSYDGNGNETGRGAGLTAFTYNAKDQTISITANGTPLAMAYTGDSQVQRIAAGETTFAYDALGLGQQTASGGSVYFTRTNGGRLVSLRIGAGSGSTKYYYLFDGLGSVVALTDGGGNVANTYSYDPYGKVTATTGTVPNPWGYTGGYMDATGLVKLGHRYYDPGVGRWTQLDPLGGGYIYVHNNPVNFTDPSGLQVRITTTSGGGGGGQPRVNLNADEREDDDGDDADEDDDEPPIPYREAIVGAEYVDPETGEVTQHVYVVDENGNYRGDFIRHVGDEPYTPLEPGPTP